MNLTIKTEPGAVINHLRPILAPIYAAAEVAVPKAYRIIAENAWPETGTLSSHLVRADMKTSLDGKRCAQFDAVIRVVEMDDIANDGLLTRFDSIDIKIRKGSTLPPAVTKSMEEFYQRSHSGLWREDGPPPIKTLIILWDCGLDGANLQLQLVCPKDATTWEWKETIPHPATWTVLKNSADHAVSDDLDDLLSDDDSEESENES